MENKINKEINQCNPYERSVGGSLFRIYATEAQIKYVDRVLEGSRDVVESNTQEAIEVVCTDNTGLSEEILNKSLQPTDSSASLIAGEIEGGRFVSLKGVFMDILISKTDNTPLAHISISQNPEYGAITFIKSYLLNKYVNQQEALVFHAGSMMSLDKASSFVISALNHHINNGDNSGKTTAILASCARENANFAYSSNDEVILSFLDNASEVKTLPFPSQITIRGKSLETLQADGVNFKLEDWNGVDSITGQSVSVITPRGVIEAGYQVLPLNPSKIDWCFIEIDLSMTNYSCVEADPQTSLQLFRGSVSKRRMNQALNPLFLGETTSAQTYNPIVYQPKIDEIFNQLVSSGTKFYILRGGADRDKINEIFTRLKR